MIIFLWEGFNLFFLSSKKSTQNTKRELRLLSTIYISPQKHQQLKKEQPPDSLLARQFPSRIKQAPRTLMTVYIYFKFKALEFSSSLMFTHSHLRISIDISEIGFLWSTHESVMSNRMLNAEQVSSLGITLGLLKEFVYCKGIVTIKYKDWDCEKPYARRSKWYFACVKCGIQWFDMLKGKGHAHARWDRLPMDTAE